MNLNLKKTAILLATFLFQLLAFGHGEDKPGPNGGYIRMPGAFHTEVVQVNDQKFKVYLLDMNWRNPTVTNSSVNAAVKFKSSEINASCIAEDNYFSCELPKGKTLQGAKEVTIKATRENVTGGIANYELPLRLFSHKPLILRGRSDEI